MRGAMMQNWITGKELMAYWDIADFELLGCLKKGLQPYDEMGRRVVDSDSLEHGKQQSLEEIIRNQRAKLNAQVLGSPGSTVRPPPTDSEIERGARIIYERQRLVILNPPKEHPYMSFSLPPNEGKALKAIKRVKCFLFKKEEVSKFAERNVLCPSDTGAQGMETSIFDNHEVKRFTSEVGSYHENISHILGEYFPLYKLQGKSYRMTFVFLVNDADSHLACQTFCDFIEELDEPPELTEFPEFPNLERWDWKVTSYHPKLINNEKVLFSRQDTSFPIEQEETDIRADSGTQPDKETDIQNEVSASEPHGNSFILKGEYWSICYEGSDEVNIKNLERIRYIVHLLEKPHHPFSAFELKRLVKGEWHETDIESENEKDQRKMNALDVGLSIEGSQAEILSDEELKRFENMMFDFWDKLEAAKDTGNEEKVSNAQQEYNEGAKYLFDEYGLKIVSSSKGPSFKKFFRSAKEANNVRLSVKGQIDKARADFKKPLPKLWEHLKGHIHTGKEVVYTRPIDFPEWRIRWNS
jgi:hypothetical protein